MDNLTLEIHPTHIKVVGAPPPLTSRLTEAFTWEDPKAKYMLRKHVEKHPTPQKWCWVCQTQGKVALYKTDTLALGFEERLLGYLQEWGIPYTVEDCRPPVPNRQYSWQYARELRDYQQDILDAILGHQVGIVEAATGGGKTAIAAATVCELGVPAIVLVPTKIISGQFLDEFKTQTDIPVGQIASGKFEEAPVQIAIVKSLLDPQGNVREEYLRDKQLLICDEFHMSASESYEKILACCPAYYRYGFSATPFRANDLESNMLTGIAGEVIAKVGTVDLQAEGFLCPTDIRMMPVKVRYDRAYMDEEGEWQDTSFADRYRQGIVENDARNAAVAEVVQKHSARGEKVLVIASWTDHCERLLGLLPDGTIYLSGKDTAKKTKDKAEQFRSQDGGVLLGSPVVDTGFDVPSVHCVVMAGGGSFDGRQRQRLGRGLRVAPGKDCVSVFDFIDDDRDTGGRPMFYQHSKARMKAYRDVGQKPKEYDSVEDALGTTERLF